jgi:CRP/FNR family cyclic AMP-dependent transcriptional regulator
VTAFKSLAAPVLDRIEARSRSVELQDVAEIFARSDASDAVHAIIGCPGCVRIGAVGRSSKGPKVEIFGTGDIFGEIVVIDSGVRTADAVADGTVQLLRVGAPMLIETLSEHAVLGRHLCGALAARLRRTFDLFQDAALESLEVRFARRVRYLGMRDGRRSEYGLRLAGRSRQGKCQMGWTNPPLDCGSQATARPGWLAWQAGFRHSRRCLDDCRTSVGTTARGKHNGCMYRRRCDAAM